MDYLIRFSQAHETFRLPEIEALASLEGIDLKVIHYQLDSPFCIVNLPSNDSARALIRRSILAHSIHELWGLAPSGLLTDLHTSVRERASSLWPEYTSAPFKFNIDAYQNTRPMPERLAIIESFTFLNLKGPIELRNPSAETFTVFEHWPFRPAGEPSGPNPTSIFMGRWLANGSRDLCRTYDLKKRGYISTTSMDSELALVTANMAHAAPGRLFYDPFVGTGSFPVAAAHFGALAFGSDIDGRSIRGKGGKKSLKGNFAQYNLLSCLGEFFTADLTNTPMIVRRWLDGIVCDPPYGVREGLKVLGNRDGDKTEIDLSPEKTWKSGSYIPPKKPYSFLAMLDDLLQFSMDMLVDDGRLSFWMPTANDDDQEIAVPTHPGLELVSICVQPFNRWSRRLITYRRLPDSQIDTDQLVAWKRRQAEGKTADELNPFRESYFKGFKRDEMT